MDGSYVSKIGNIVKDNATDIICMCAPRSRNDLPFADQSHRVRSTVYPVFPKNLLQDLRPTYGVRSTL